MIIYDLGDLSGWLTSIGTISAVVVALYLSRKDDKPRAQVKSTISYEVSSDGSTPLSPVSVNLEIVNTGKIPIHLAECTIMIGRFKKDKMVFIDNKHIVNVLLKQGDFYEHHLPFEAIRLGLQKEGIKKLKSYIYFKSSVGEKYKTGVTLHS